MLLREQTCDLPDTEHRSERGQQAVDEYGNVTSTAIITVPKGCCFSIAVRYVDATTDDPATEPTPLIEVQNSNLVINRIA